VKLIYDKSIPGRRAIRNVASGVTTRAQIKPQLLRENPPELGELGELAWTTASTRSARAR